MRPVQMFAVPDQGRTQAERRMQALVGVHNHGVGQFYPAKPVPDQVAQDKKPAVGPVHVKP